MIGKLDIICYPPDFEEIKARFPKRTLYPTPYGPPGYIYYLGSDGHVRWMRLYDNSVYTCDLERGFPHVRRLR